MLKILVGLSLVSVVCELLFGGGSYKKYVNALLGVITLLVMLEGVFSLKPLKDINVLFEESDKVTKLTLSEAEKEIALTLSENIKKQLINSGIPVTKVNVFLKASMELDKITIRVKGAYDKDALISELCEKNGVDPELVKIEIKEEK